MDLTPLVQAAAALVLAALTAATPFIAPLVRQYLHVRLTEKQAAAIQNAAEMGAKAAYGYIAASGKSYLVPEVRNAALQRGFAHALESVPDTMAAIGVTPEHVRSMVEARFGGLLHEDPGVSISQPVSAEAPARIAS
jgi:hypothetical protein